jgi:hypothetical protein
MNLTFGDTWQMKRGYFQTTKSIDNEISQTPIWLPKHESIDDTWGIKLTIYYVSFNH